LILILELVIGLRRFWQFLHRVNALAALLGTIFGSKLLKKVAIRQIEILASIMLLAVSLALALGYI
jgi:uncharacterized membrane protein YfcA